MQDIREARFYEGQAVKALIALHNDGSYPDRGDDVLLVSAGEAGQVVQVGLHIATNVPVYMVEFTNDFVVGCLESEIAPL